MVQELEVLTADVLPFLWMIRDCLKVNEELRLKYRYLDLRRPEMMHHLRLRSKVATATRVFMEEEAFEVETPTLFKSTPEGARISCPKSSPPSQCYALPQSPQQFKQILIVSGVEKYLQLARCYRDEDLRADRQPEFTQVDIEMSFIDREDIYRLLEGLMGHVWRSALGLTIPENFRRITFEEAMNTYGIDKPDTRFGLEIHDFCDAFDKSTFKVFSGKLEKGWVIKELNAKGLADDTGQMGLSSWRSVRAPRDWLTSCGGRRWKSPSSVLQ